MVGVNGSEESNEGEGGRQGSAHLVGECVVRESNEGDGGGQGSAHLVGVYVSAGIFGVVSVGVILVVVMGVEVICKCVLRGCVMKWRISACFLPLLLLAFEVAAIFFFASFFFFAAVFFLFLILFDIVLFFFCDIFLML